MSESVKKLQIINLLCYISYLLYLLILYKTDAKGWFAILVVLPIFMVIISSFVVFNGKKEINTFKILAIADLLIRTITLFINYSLKVKVIFSLNYNISIMSILVLFSINILLEKLMYNKAKEYKEISDNTKSYDIPFDDRLNLINMMKSVNRALLEIPFLFVIITTLLGLSGKSDITYLIAIVLLDISFLIIFLKLNYSNLALFYKDKNSVRREFIKENSFVLISIIIGSMFAVLRINNIGNGISFIVYFIQWIFIFPNFDIRHKRVAKVEKIRQAMEN